MGELVARYSTVWFVLIAFMAMTFVVYAFTIWRRDRRIENEREERRELRASEAQMQAEIEAEKREERRDAANKAGSGGYIVMDMPEEERPLFHDLLKGFEDYARLKGYEIAFSIDSSFESKIAFKFTVKNDGVVVGPERVRQDFKDYVAQVRTGKIEDLDEIPVVTNLEEHDLLVALLKNRISFLQHNYQLKSNAVEYYETLLANTRTFPVLPAPTVIVQTGGRMDARQFEANNSSRLLQGDGTYTDTSVNIEIGNSFNERQARIVALDDVIEKLKSSDNRAEPVVKAERELKKVRDELAEYPEPDKSTIKKWMEYAKQLMSTAALGYEIVEAARHLFALFGMK